MILLALALAALCSSGTWLCLAHVLPIDLDYPMIVVGQAKSPLLIYTL